MVLGYEMRSSNVDEAVAMGVKQWLLSHMKPPSRLGITSPRGACALPELAQTTVSLLCYPNDFLSVLYRASLG